MRQTTPLTLVAKVVAVAVLLVGLLAGLGILAAAGRAADLAADVRTREIAASSVPTLGGALRTALTQAETGRAGNPPTVDLDRSEEAGVPAAVAVQARDSGRAVVVDTGAVVAATYSTGDPPKSVAERRAKVTGLYVVPLALGPTVERLRPLTGGVSVTSPSGTLGEVGGRAPDGAATYSVPLATTLVSGWQVDVWTPEHSIGLLAWLLAAVCLLAAAGVAAYVVRRAREVHATENELVALRQRSAVLAGLAGVAQRSLDLADVLPAVSTQLSDALGLRGLSLTAPSAAGERAFFRHGEAPVPVVGAVLPPAVPAGESVSLLLSRAGRTIARLNVLPGRDLDTEDMNTLEAAGEILTSALTNAEAFAQQREALQRLRTVDELKTVFLATASHELRTPVGVISGFAELLATHVDALDAAKVRDYAARIDSTAQQLSSLVENLLDFSRMERGITRDQDNTLLDLGDTVRRVLDEHQDLGADHEVIASTPSGLLVEGTEHAVERVLTNLVGNAAKYSPSGTRIRVHVRQEGDKVALHVDDEGDGVAPADRDQVFSRFYRGSGDAVVNTRGAGLGLAIVHEFAGSMGGVASVSEAPSGGARFTVLFPLAAPADADVATDAAGPAGTADHPSVQGARDVLT